MLTLSSFLLLLSILLVLVSVLCCVCVAGRYCFRLIAAVVVDFSLLLFTHTCRSFSFSLSPLSLSFILLANEKYFHSSYIRTYFNSFFYLCHNSSLLSFFSYFNLICCIPFSPDFSFSLSLSLAKKNAFLFLRFFQHTHAN